MTICFNSYLKSAARHLSILMLVLITTIAQTGCSTIDDDLSECGTDYRMDYEMRLVTNMTTELQTQLNTVAEANVAKALKQHLSTIFTDVANDISLSFFDTVGDSAILHHEAHIINKSQHSYTLYLPKRKYAHVALANIQNNGLVKDVGGEKCHDFHLEQPKADTIESHATGLFTARQDMDVLEGVDQTFDVRLYMANCANVFIVDPRGHSTDGMKIYVTGFASSFNPADSTYNYVGKSPIVRPTLIKTEGSSLLSYCAVTFPSREKGVDTKTIIETEDPFKSSVDTKSVWRYIAYVKQPDGSVTATKLSMMQPIRAGQLKIVKAYIDDDGSLKTSDASVAVSVQLNWNDNMTEDVDL